MKYACFVDDNSIQAYPNPKKNCSKKVLKRNLMKYISTKSSCVGMNYLEWGNINFNIYGNN